MHWADRDAGTGCLVSRYSVGSHGYAQMGWVEAGRKVFTLAHRVIWQWHNGMLADGRTVDHTCKNKRCMELAHMRELSNYENARRTSGRDWPLGECINGHPNSELRQHGKRRRCRLCTNGIQQRRRAASKPS